MKTVTINGVVLTEEQVRKAVKELDAPTALKAGDIVVCSNRYLTSKYLVLSSNSWINTALEKSAPLLSNEVRITDGISAWHFEITELKKVRSLYD